MKIFGTGVSACMVNFSYRTRVYLRPRGAYIHIYIGHFRLTLLNKLYTIDTNVVKIPASVEPSSSSLPVPHTAQRQLVTLAIPVTVGPEHCSARSTVHVRGSFCKQRLLTERAEKPAWLSPFWLPPSPVFDDVDAFPPSAASAPVVQLTYLQLLNHSLR